MGLLQHNLSRITCEWGRDVRTHDVVFPVFARDYKVLGILGYSLATEPVWYGEVPVHVGKRGLRFKAAFRERGPQPVGATESGLFDGTYICDPWGVVAVAIQSFSREKGRAVPVNIHGQSFLGGEIVGTEFEPPLHRVRGLVVRRGTFRRQTLSVMALPALAESLRPATTSRRGRLRWPWVRRD
jgi:hypothetical protein